MPWMSSLQSELGFGILDNLKRLMHNCRKLPGGHRAQKQCWPLGHSRSCKDAHRAALRSPSTTLLGLILLWQVIHLWSLDLQRAFVHTPVFFSWNVHLKCFQRDPLCRHLGWAVRAWQLRQNFFPSPTEQMHIWETTEHVPAMGYHLGPNFLGLPHSRSIVQNLHIL